MKLAALYSGGKDSTFAIYRAKEMGHEVACLVTMHPVADDSPLIQQTLSRLLHSAGYTVVLAENGEELVRTALADPPTLILVDIHMPIMDGPEAVRQLRADHRTVNVPIVMMSAHPEAVTLALDAGADGFLYKPFTIDEILHSIAHHI